jgi:hypothetical protein
MFVIGIIYRIITRFIMPVFHVGNTVNDRLRDMQNQMRDMEQKVNQTAKTSNRKKDGDYIDYEEVR